MYIRTGRPEFDNLPDMVQGFLEKDILDLVIDGKKIRGYRSPDAKSVWIRDYSDMIRGFRYFEKDLKSTVSHFADTQSLNGRIFDYFTTYPEKLPCERENWTKYVRVPVEADVARPLHRPAKKRDAEKRLLGNELELEGKGDQQRVDVEGALMVAHDYIRGGRNVLEACYCDFYTARLKMDFCPEI